MSEGDKKFNGQREILSSSGSLTEAAAAWSFAVRSVDPLSIFFSTQAHKDCRKHCFRFLPPSPDQSLYFFFYLCSSWNKIR